MKKFFYFSVALLSFLLISCGDKEKEAVLPDKILLTHEQYFALVKSAAKAEIDFEILAQAKKGEALELLILEGWRPADCFCKGDDNLNEDFNYKKQKKGFDNFTKPKIPEHIYYVPEPISHQMIEEKIPYITNAPVINNYCYGGAKKEIEETEQVEVEDPKNIKNDTLIKKVLPWELELGAGFARGPLGSLRFGNSRAEAGGLFLWNRKNKIANNLVDIVVRPKNGEGFRYGIFYHNEIAPEKWNIPSVETKTVSAGGVSTTVSSTRNVEVEQWNVRKQTIGPILGLQTQNENYLISADLMPGFVFQKEGTRQIDFNARFYAGYKVNEKTLIGLNLGFLNQEFYPMLSVRLVPGLEKTTDNN